MTMSRILASPNFQVEAWIEPPFSRSVLEGLSDEVFEGGVFAVEASMFWDSLCLGCC